MKKILAAFTAVILAAGISLASAVLPASAASTPTPKPTASSTPKATPTPVATTAPKVTPTPTATPKPTATATSTPTATPTPAPSTPSPSTSDSSSSPAVPPITFAAAASTQSINTTDAPADPYVTVVWSMPTWNGAQSATYPQTLVSQTAEATVTLDVSIPGTCGTQYQVDSYVASDSLTTFLAYYTGGAHTLAGPDGAQDGGYLAPGGWNVAYKLVQNAACPPPCIPDSKVIYTYSGNDANSGTITVPTLAGYSNLLCEPFYVTATSWKYTSNSVWPQNVDVVDHVNGTPTASGNVAISSSGVYTYAAQITCGQGDIYASFTQDAATLFPENPGYLNAPGNPLPEHFLHDMGFSGPNPTYHQDNTSCFTPTPETGKPVTTVATCTAGSVNSVTLPVIMGGVWTIKSGTTVVKTYPISTGGVWTPTVFEGYTIVLTDGSSTDGFTVTGTSTDYTPVDASTLDCNTQVTPTKPTATPINQCGVDGSITIIPTAGVVYKINGTPVSGTVTGLSGDVTVTVAYQTGYEAAPGAASSWLFHLGAEETCPVTVIVDQCTSDGTNSTEAVSLKFDNSASSVSSSFKVVVNGVIYNTFVVAAGSTETDSVGTVPTTGGTIDVYINGSVTPIVEKVASFVGCVPVTPGDPHVTPLTCALTTTIGGSVTTDGNPDLVYSLSAATVNPPTAGYPTTVFITPTISGLAAGNYVVTVTAVPGFILAGATSFPLTIDLAPVNCTGTTLTPVVTSAATCAATGIITTAARLQDGSLIHTAVTYVDGGVINLPQQAGILIFKINDVEQDATAVPEANGGPYVVTVFLTSLAVTDGYVLADPSVSWSYSFDSICPLPTEAAWNAGVSQTSATCSATTAVDGTISLEHDASQTGEVIYTITNSANHTVYTGTNTVDAQWTTVNVGPGTYTVSATPANLADGLVGNGTVSGHVMSWTIGIGVVGTNCNPSLAFTGGTIAWIGFALAGGMLFLGFALLFVRRRRNGTAE